MPDYLMGVFIVVEGTYSEGDNISAGDPAWGVAGTVESVGLRRTVVRDPDGTLHSVSNARMRQVSNRARVFAAAEVHIRGTREEGLGQALAIMDRVGQERRWHRAEQARRRPSRCAQRRTCGPALRGPA